MSKSKHISMDKLKIAVDRAVDQKFLDRHPGDCEKENKIADLVKLTVENIKEKSLDSKSFYKNIMEVSRRLESVASEYQRQFFVSGEIYLGEFEE